MKAMIYMTLLPDNGWKERTFFFTTNIDFFPREDDEFCFGGDGPFTVSHSDYDLITHEASVGLDSKNFGTEDAMTEYVAYLKDFGWEEDTPKPRSPAVPV